MHNNAPSIVPSQQFLSSYLAHAKDKEGFPSSQTQFHLSTTPNIVQMASAKSRALGCIWGNCIGDALGGPVQFKPKGQFAPVTGLRFVEPFGQPAG